VDYEAPNVSCWGAFAVAALVPESNALMRTPNTVEYRLSYDKEFLPAWSSVADRRKT
jgi:hypothetical protein